MRCESVGHGLREEGLRELCLKKVCGEWVKWRREAKWRETHLEGGEVHGFLADVAGVEGGDELVDGDAHGVRRRMRGVESGRGEEGSTR